MLKQNLENYFLFVVLAILYCLTSYGLERYQTAELVSSYAFLFLTYFWILKKALPEEVNFWCWASIIFRVLLLFSLPNLSDDFYRFIWDGRLLANGYHPFAEIPSYYIEKSHSIPGIDEELFLNLNSPEYYTIYPPLAQFIFLASVKLSPFSITGSVLFLKILAFTAEIGSLYLIRKLLHVFGLPARSILLYALNPLVILELTGNLHLEVFMIFFLLASIYLLYYNKILLSGVFFASAVCVKLLPLILLPAFLRTLGIKKALVFYTITLVITALLFLPLLDWEIVKGFNNSLGYYFKKFEFNASIYYLIRKWGYIMYGYNIIQTVGWKLGIISGATILSYIIISWAVKYKKRNVDSHLQYLSIMTDLMFIFLIYLLFTTTVHPWYITPMVAFSVFSYFRFSILWSCLIFITYMGYSASGFQENLWTTTFEYLLVAGFLVYEIVRWFRMRNSTTNKSVSDLIKV